MDQFNIKEDYGIILYRNKINEEPIVYNGVKHPEPLAIWMWLKITPVPFDLTTETMEYVRN